MKVEKIFVGGWFQRTTLHLSEIYDFLKEAKSPLDLNKKNGVKFINNPFTTQIESHDTYRELFDIIRGLDLVLIDTAGRHTLDKELIKELKELNSEIKPTETILVMPADVGQAAKKQAKEFQEALKISGVIINSKAIIPK